MRSTTTRFASWFLLSIGLIGLFIPRGDTPNRTSGVACGFYFDPATAGVYTLYAQVTLHQERFLGTAVGVSAQVVFTQLKQSKANASATTREAAVEIARNYFIQSAQECGEPRGLALFDAAITSPDGKVTLVQTSRYPLAIARFAAPFVAAIGGLGLAAYLHANWRSKRTAGACPQCGYDVRSLGHAPACPECGKSHQQ